MSATRHLHRGGYYRRAGEQVCVMSPEECEQREADMDTAFATIDELRERNHKIKDEWNSMFSGEYHLKTVRDLKAELDAERQRARTLREAAREFETAVLLCASAVSHSPHALRVWDTRRALAAAMDATSAAYSGDDPSHADCTPGTVFACPEHATAADAPSKSGDEPAPRAPAMVVDATERLARIAIIAQNDTHPPEATLREIVRLATCMDSSHDAQGCHAAPREEPYK